MSERCPDCGTEMMAPSWSDYYGPVMADLECPLCTLRVQNAALVAELERARDEWLAEAHKAEKHRGKGYVSELCLDRAKAIDAVLAEARGEESEVKDDEA